MQIKKLKLAMEYLINSNITPMLIGHHGVGKSQAIAQFCNEKGYNFIDLRLGTQDPGDLIGLPAHEVHTETGRMGTKFMPPEWLLEHIAFCEKNPNKFGVVFLDEMNRARRDVLQAIFQLVLDRKMNTLVLPKNTAIVAAMNPNTEDYIVNDISDKALVDRFCHIKLSPSVDEWLDYARENGFDSEVVGFITEQKELLKDNKLQDFDLDFIKPSARSWDAVSRLRKAGTPDEILRELGMGLVGSAAITAFMSHLKNSDKPIEAKEILNNYSKYKAKIETYSDDKSETGGRMDLIKYTVDNVNNFIKTNKKKLTPKNLKNLESFLVDIPSDISFHAGRELYTEDEAVRKMVEESTELKTKWKTAREKTEKKA